MSLSTPDFLGRFGAKAAKEEVAALFCSIEGTFFLEQVCFNSSAEAFSLS